MARQAVWGWHTVGHLLTTRPQDVLVLTVLEGRDDARARALEQQAEVAGVHVSRAARTVLDKLAHGASHQGVVAHVRPSPERSDDALADALAERAGPRLWLVLDGVQDPHNLGACLRAADGAGCAGVIAPRRRAAGLGDTVRKVACGAAESVPFYRVTNLARTLRALGEHGVYRVGTSDSADKSLYELDLSGDLAVVMGGEAKGLRRLTAEHCDALASLPMLGAVESLNVSVAAGVCLYEAGRQRVARARPNP